ncbi:lipopolysaccharide transport periplasmic protein LptA [Lysobacter sp. D1-1-M9]|uniref:lipopolysaccharide transport periplasmic protein LptA n=1 Tax=Novilysobacter longmucuonensis TaxID=3098603 RepID=UPI002FC66D84
MKALPASLLALVLAAASSTALARSSDRNQPMDIDAGEFDYSLDESRPTVASRGVIITQGTLDVRSSRASIFQRNGEAVRVVLTGGPARLSQQLDNGDPMTAAANQIDYDLRTEIVVFTGDVRVAQPGNTLSGQRIVYNMQTGRVQGGGEGAGRVRMRIMPRNTGASESSGGAADTDTRPDDTSDSDGPEGG